MLKPFGITLTREASSEVPSLGAKTGSEGNEVKLTTVYTGGPTQQAGLSAGDVLVAIDGLRVTAGTLERQLARRQAGDRIELDVFRRDELIRFSVCLAAAEPGTTRLTAGGKNDLLCKAWLSR